MLDVQTSAGYNVKDSAQGALPQLRPPAPTCLKTLVSFFGPGTPTSSIPPPPPPLLLPVRVTWATQTPPKKIPPHYSTPIPGLLCTQEPPPIPPHMHTHTQRGFLCVYLHLLSMSPQPPHTTHTWSFREQQPINHCCHHNKCNFCTLRNIRYL